MTADLLKRAATKLRETAAEAPAPPWRVTLNYNRKHPKVVAGATWFQPGVEKSISLKHAGNLGQAQWNAPTHPGVAEPLAVWLESTATTMGWLAPHRQSERECAMWQSACDFAREILGEATS